MIVLLYGFAYAKKIPLIETCSSPMIWLNNSPVQFYVGFYNQICMNFTHNLWESYSFAYKRLKKRKLSIFTKNYIIVVAKLFIFIEFFQVNCLPFEASKIDEPINETIAENVELEELEAQQYEGGRIVNSSSIKSLSNRKVNFKKLLKMTNWRIF